MTCTHCANGNLEDYLKLSQEQRSSATECCALCAGLSRSHVEQAVHHLHDVSTEALIDVLQVRGFQFHRLGIECRAPFLDHFMSSGRPPKS